MLIPRPESELLVRQAVQSLDIDSAVTIADVGTGSGCLAVSLAKALPQATIYALDLSEPALQVARRNIRRHTLEDRIVCVQGDLLTPLGHLRLMGKVDIIVSNPPYVTEAEWSQLQPEVRKFEPRSALYGGQNGTHVQRRLLEEAWRYLTPGGLLLMEMGWHQSAMVSDLAVGTGHYGAPSFCFDEAGLPVCCESECQTEAEFIYGSHRHHRGNTIAGNCPHQRGQEFGPSDSGCNNSRRRRMRALECSSCGRCGDNGKIASDPRSVSDP